MSADEAAFWRRRARELEARLQESEETLDAIRRGGSATSIVRG